MTPSNHLLLSRSLGEFWGERWNTAFNQLAAKFMFRPLRRPLGTRGATMAVFLASGLLHDLVISVPARGGYGLPTLYFLLQGLAVLAERRCLPGQKTTAMHKGLAVTQIQTGSGRGWLGWLWTLLCTAGPIGLLFHPPFIKRVILPFLQVIGAF